MLRSTLLVLGTALLLSAVEAQRRCTMDLTFMIDSSGSICDRDPTKETTIVDGKRMTNCENWGLNVGFTAAIVEGLEIGQDETRVAAVLFANQGELLWDLNEYDDSDDVVDALENIVYKGGNTNTSGGLRTIMRSVLTPAGGDREDVTNVVVIVTDGVSTRDAHLTIGDSTDLKRDKNAVIFVVGITDQVSREDLRDMSSPPQEEGKNYFLTTDFDQLDSIIGAMINLTCTSIATQPPTTTTTTTTTTAPPVEGCSNQVDMVFVVDSSGSIRSKNFVFVRDFVANMIGMLAIDSGNSRVGLIQFSSNVYQTQYRLDNGLSGADMQNVARNMPYIRGTTNTAAALDHLVDFMFTSNRGDRNDVPNVVVFLTDGNSNDKDATVEAAMKVKSAGIHVLAVQMGSWVNPTELKAIASHPWERNLLEVDDFDRLDRIEDQLRDLICNNVDDCSSNPCRNDGECVDGIGRFWCICEDNWGGVRCQYHCREPSDVVFNLDASGSIRKENFETMVRFAQTVAEELPIDGETRVGLETFATDAKIYFYLNTHNNRQAILNAMSLPYYMGGTTNAAESFSTMRENMFVGNRGDRNGVPNVGVTITDGKHPMDPTNAKNEALETREEGIDMISVAIGTFKQTNYLRDITSFPMDNNIFSIDRMDDLEDIVEELRDTICNAEDECESDPCRNGGDCFDDRNGYHCECRDDFTGINCERECTGEADIVFMVDKSGSIRSKRFLVVQEFFVGLLNQLEIWDDKIRVGALSFSTNAMLEFDLNTFQSKHDIIQGVRNIRYTGGRTNIADGLELARDLFQSSRGDRENVPNYLIMFTDGQANERPDETIPEAITTRISGVHIISVGVGSVDTRELMAIASDPSPQNTFSVNSFNDLEDIADGVLMSFCNDEDSCDDDPCVRGTCIDGLNTYVCECPSSTTGRNCERRCSEQMDLVIILDFSGSVDEVHDWIVSLTEQVVYGIDFRQDRARVGIITYSSDARVKFYLDAYSEQKDVLNALSFAESGGRTNTQAALELAADELFNSRNGDRNSVDNKIIIMTDGGSNMDQENTIPAAENLKDEDEADAEIFVVAVGDRVDMSEINGMASGSSPPHILRVNSQSDADDAAVELLEELCG